MRISWPRACAPRSIRWMSGRTSLPPRASLSVSGRAVERVTMLAAVMGIALSMASWAADPAPLVLEAKIPLGAVAGRIDHFAFDADQQILFVAELGNNTVGIVDLKERKVLRRLPQLIEPQRLSYQSAT